jgi:DNA polymerase III subunit epsilon
VQRSFDDLGTPLAEVTFSVLDLETTGGSSHEDTITEIGVVKVRGGECLGTFHTLVHPGRSIPRAITVLTGITDAMVGPAPRLEAVLPALIEFLQGSVIVGHNIRFDLGFLRAAMAVNRWPSLTHRWVDTCALARRLVRDEVPNCRLQTLASRFRLDHRPAHRALDDALATTDLFHLLLERAASWGVLGLDDLLALPGLGAHPQAAKLRLTTHLPRAPGVYQFVDGRGEVLYVGKATNLRQRVRSYFAGDDRRKIGNLLREARGVRHQVCTSTIHAAVVEARLIRDLRPRYNRRGTQWATYPYVKLTLSEAFPRLVLARTVKADGDLYLGPLSSRVAAALVIEAIQSVAPLRRCGQPLGPRTAGRRATPCASSQLGVALCPCAGEVEGYAAAVQLVAEGLTRDPAVLLDPLQARMTRLAAAGRFEEAAATRDRAAALAAAMTRQRRLDGLRRAGRIRVRLTDGAGIEVIAGALSAAWGAGDAEPPPALWADGPSPEGPLPRLWADEVAFLAAWLDDAARAGKISLEHCDEGLSSPRWRLPSFTPIAARAA